MAKQLGFYFNAKDCIGCKTCGVACKARHDLPVGVTWRRVFDYGGGSWVMDRTNGREVFSPNNIFAYSLSISCNHCENPKCLEVCPTAAISKREDGIVLINTDRCIGCKYCAWACPYGAPQFNEELGIMTKCDMCVDLIDQNQRPLCVDACLMRCLDFGDIEELQAKYGSVDAIAPLPPGDITNPALVITPHGYAKPVGDTSGRILNLPEEI